MCSVFLEVNSISVHDHSFSSYLFTWCFIHNQFLSNLGINLKFSSVKNSCQPFGWQSSSFFQSLWLSWGIYCRKWFFTNQFLKVSVGNIKHHMLDTSLSPNQFTSSNFSISFVVNMTYLLCDMPAIYFSFLNFDIHQQHVHSFIPGRPFCQFILIHSNFSSAYIDVLHFYNFLILEFYLQIWKQTLSVCIIVRDIP